MCLAIHITYDCLLDFIFEVGSYCKNSGEMAALFTTHYLFNAKGLDQDFSQYTNIFTELLGNFKMIR